MATTVGNVASGATDGGNPVKVSGVYNSTPPTFTSGQRGDLQIGTRGSLAVSLFAQNGANAAGLAVGIGDATPSSITALQTTAILYLSNGTTFDVLRTPTVFKTVAAVAITAGTPVAIWTPAAGKKFRLLGYVLSLSVAGSVILKDAATESIRTPLMAAGIGQPSPPFGNGILSAAANNALNADVTATGSVSGYVFGTEE